MSKDINPKKGRVLYPCLIWMVIQMEKTISVIDVLNGKVPGSKQEAKEEVIVKEAIEPEED